MLRRRVGAAGLAAVLAVLGSAGPVGAGDGSSGDLPEPVVPAEDVRRQADEILDQRQFQRPEPNLVERAEQWVDEQLAKLFQEATSGSTGSIVGWVILILGVAALVYFLRRVGRTVRADPRRAPSVTVERTRTADEWDEDAASHEQSGEWKAALRSRFRALTTRLVDLGRVDDVPGRTAGEYRGEVAASVPAASGQFAEATRLFEDAWYGDRPTGAPENARFRTLADEVVAEARSVERRGQHRTEVPA